MNVVILAAGTADRWGDYLGVPKQFAPVEGEPIVARTVRQARENGCDEVVVLVPAAHGRVNEPWCDHVDPRWQVPGARAEVARHRGPDETDKILSGVAAADPDRWTAVVWGDTWLSDYAAKTMFAERGHHAWFGRRDKSELTGCAWGEIFGFLVPPAVVRAPFPFGPSTWRERIVAAVYTVRALVAHGCYGIGDSGRSWHVYRVLDGLHPNVPSFGASWVDIDDWTDDFDLPEDYDRWVARRAAWRAAGGVE